MHLQSQPRWNFPAGFLFWDEATKMILMQKAEPQPTRGVNRDSGTDRANGGWLRQLVRPILSHGFSGFIGCNKINIGAQHPSKPTNAPRTTKNQKLNGSDCRLNSPHRLLAFPSLNDLTASA
jgi:hypothetical protein